MNNYLVTFFSTHHALKAEKILKKELAEIDLIPTPREISSECGFSVLIKKDTNNIKKYIAHLSYEHCYLIIENNKKEKTYEKID